MKIDLHIHTSPLTQRSLMRTGEAFERARACGFDGLVFTEYRVVRYAEAYMHLADIARVRYGLTLLQGLYVDTTLGPVLVYGQSIAQSGHAGLLIDHCPDTFGFLHYCIEHGWAVVLAHPFRYDTENPGICSPFKHYEDPVSVAVKEVGYIIRKMQAIEITGSASKEENNLAVGLAQELNIPLVAGSGACHSAQMRPGCYTKIPDSIDSSDRLAAEMFKAAKVGTDNDRIRIPELKGLYSAGKASRIARRRVGRARGCE